MICFLAFAQLQILIPLAGWVGQTRRVSIMEESIQATDGVGRARVDRDEQ